ncbi:TM2 domain-containing protein CG10795-like [Pecten maximus]|uniref:TM2 domain-containing protein CG10795-like n=1 Tax=Pecten maximus TaxID=6579 RepID=UPI0014591009|nr:TM2 domain-containing protein CG10795-like [Pecten maximus]
MKLGTVTPPVFLLVYLLQILVTGSKATTLRCETLLLGQYTCREPEIDIDTQSAKGCRENRTVLVPCMPAEEINCIGLDGQAMTYNGTIVGFLKEIPCRWTNGYSFETSLLLSIFLGMFGIDRFYLGYPAIGLLKFSTLGFFFLGQLVDIILIATQVVTPSDGSDYVIDYYGAGLTKIIMDKFTFVKPPDS